MCTLSVKVNDCLFILMCVHSVCIVQRFGPRDRHFTIFDVCTLVLFDGGAKELAV